MRQPGVPTCVSRPRFRSPLSPYKPYEQSSPAHCDQQGCREPDVEVDSPDVKVRKRISCHPNGEQHPIQAVGACKCKQHQTSPCNPRALSNQHFHLSAYPSFATARLSLPKAHRSRSRSSIFRLGCRGNLPSRANLPGLVIGKEDTPARSSHTSILSCARGWCL